MRATDRHRDAELLARSVARAGSLIFAALPYLVGAACLTFALFFVIDSIF